MKENFIKKFSFPVNFLEPTDLIDSYIGFSVYKTYPKNVDFRSLFKVAIKRDIFESGDSLKPIIAVVDYGKFENGGITTFSSDFKRQLNWPVGLISQDEFFYDISKDSLLYKGKEITGEEMISMLDKWHMKTTAPFSLLRIKMIFYHKILSSIMKLLFYLFSGVRYLLFGERIKIYDNFNEPDKSMYTPSVDVSTAKKDKKINIFGYEVEPYIAFAYCLVNFILYIYFLKDGKLPLVLESILNNNFSTLMYVILSLGLFNHFLPKLKAVKVFNNKLFNKPVLLEIIQNLYIKCISKKFDLN